MLSSEPGSRLSGDSRSLSLQPPIPSQPLQCPLAKRSPLNCRRTLSGSTTQEIVVIVAVAVVRCHCVVSSMWLLSSSVASSVAYKSYKNMWWSRKLASRCLRLHRAKSTASEPEQTLGIIGVPFAKGQGKQGVELAPDLLRQSSLRQVLQSSHGKLEPRESYCLEGEKSPFPIKKKVETFT